MITQFRSRYPHGSLISELVKIYHGNYVVRAAVQVDDLILATGLAAASTVEVAEDKARNRALALLDLDLDTELVRGGGDRESDPSPELSEDNKNHPAGAPPSLRPQPPQEREKMPSTSGSKKFDKPSEAFPFPVEEEEVKQWDQFSTPENSKVPDKETTSVPSTPDYPKKEEVNSSTPVSATEEPTTLDFNEIIAQMNGEMKRLGWNKEQGKSYLLETYGKRSRHLLNDEELLVFLAYLQTLPTPS